MDFDLKSYPMLERRGQEPLSLLLEKQNSARGRYYEQTQSSHLCLLPFSKLPKSGPTCQFSCLCKQMFVVHSSDSESEPILVSGAQR